MWDLAQPQVPQSVPWTLISSRRYLLCSALAREPVLLDAAASLSGLTLGRCQCHETENCIHTMQYVKQSSFLFSVEWPLAYVLPKKVQVRKIGYWWRPRQIQTSERSPADVYQCLNAESIDLQGGPKRTETFVFCAKGKPLKGFV